MDNNEDYANTELLNVMQFEDNTMLETSRRPETSELFQENDCLLQPHSHSLYDQVIKLSDAITLNNLEDVKKLLQAGINPNTEESNGVTPIITYALFSSLSQSHNPDILRLLLKYGASPTKICNAGVRRQGRMQMAEIFMFGNKNTIRVFLEANPDFSAKDLYGQNALHYMARNSKPDIFKELKNVKYDVNARDNGNSTPLHLIEPINLGAVKFLLERGAEINAKNDEGMTVFMKVWQDPYCRKYDKYYLERSKQVIEYLLLNGADLQTVILGNTVSIFSDVGNKTKMYWVMSVLAHLAVTEARGTPVDEYVSDRIKENSLLSDHFDKCKLELKKMNAVTVFKSISLYKLLIARQSEIERYVCNKQLVSNLRRMRNKNLYIPYYRYTLRTRILKAIQNVSMKKIVSVYLSEATGISYNSQFIIFDKIVDYLSETDLLKMCASRNYS